MGDAEIAELVGNTQLSTQLQHKLEKPVETALDPPESRQPLIFASIAARLTLRT